MQPLNQPTHNLDLLRTLYIVKACFNFFAALFFLFYALFGSFMFGLFNQLPDADQQTHFPVEFTWFVLAIGIAGVVVCLILGIVTLLAAKRIKNRTGYNFIFVIAIVNCFTGMLGIGLGVFTFVELNKPHVKSLFYPEEDRNIGF